MQIRTSLVAYEPASETPSAVMEELVPKAGVGRVCAVVVTYNRTELLKKVLGGLSAQSRRPDAVLVVNNASTESLTAALSGHEIRLDLKLNEGAAGGFFAGCVAAHQAGFEWVWILDDDVVPEENCLAELLTPSESSGPTLVRVPARIEATGQERLREAVIDFSRQTITRTDPQEARIDIFTFEGPLVHCTVFDRIGYPDRRFFISGDDTDFAIKVARAFGGGAAVRVQAAIVLRQIAPLERPLVLGLFPVVAEKEMWKTAYYLRNRHLMWRTLGWRRQRLRQIALHAAFIAGDLAVAIVKGWDWRLRASLNMRAFLQGVRGQGGRLVDPAEYLASLRKGR